MLFCFAQKKRERLAALLSSARRAAENGLFAARKSLIRAEMEKSEKRTRSSNFSFEEKSSLLYLVGKYYAIIENKRTDSTTSRIKDQAWLRVASEFNKDVDTELQRNMKQLRICYENIKRKMKRENISPFEYYSKKPHNNQSLKKIVPILPKPEGEEPENMFVMVNPDMVTSDPYDSNDGTNLSCEDECGRDQNSMEYCSTPIISIQRTGTGNQNSAAHLSTNDSGIRIVSVDSCAPSSNLITESIRMGLPESTSVNRFCRQPSSLSPSTETNELVESSENGKTRKLSEEQRDSSTFSEEEDCTRLKRKLIRRQLKKCKRETEMELERHLFQLELMQAESKRKEEICQLEKEALLAKRSYYQHLLSQSKGNDEGAGEAEELAEEEEIPSA